MPDNQLRHISRVHCPKNQNFSGIADISQHHRFIQGRNRCHLGTAFHTCPQHLLITAAIGIRLDDRNNLLAAYLLDFLYIFRNLIQIDFHPCLTIHLIYFSLFQSTVALLYAIYIPITRNMTPKMPHTLRNELRSAANTLRKSEGS